MSSSCQNSVRVICPCPNVSISSKRSCRVCTSFRVNPNASHALFAWGVRPQCAMRGGTRQQRFKHTQ